jgi:hypothetical protein
MMTYALIVVSITFYGSTHTERIPGFPSMQSCTEFGAGYVESLKPSDPNLRRQWWCEIGKIDEHPPAWWSK